MKGQEDMAELDIAAVKNIAAEAINKAKESSTVNNAEKTNDDAFSNLLSEAMGLVNDTNKLATNAEAEQLNFAMGYTDNAHDLAVAQQKALLSLQYTVAVKNKFMEAYKEIMNIQI